jgi:hypothetical protein
LWGLSFSFGSHECCHFAQVFGFSVLILRSLNVVWQLLLDHVSGTLAKWWDCGDRIKIPLLNDHIEYKSAVLM